MKLSPALAIFALAILATGGGTMAEPPEVLVQDRYTESFYGVSGTYPCPQCWAGFFLAAEITGAVKGMPRRQSYIWLSYNRRTSTGQSWRTLICFPEPEDAAAWQLAHPASRVRFERVIDTRMCFNNGEVIDLAANTRVRSPFPSTVVIRVEVSDPLFTNTDWSHIKTTNIEYQTWTNFKCQATGTSYGTKHFWVNGEDWFEGVEIGPLKVNEIGLGLQECNAVSAQQR